MTSKQRAYLKGLAMNIEPVFQIGKSGLTPEVTEAVRESFNRKELVKLAVLTAWKIRMPWRRFLRKEPVPRWYRSLEKRLYFTKRTKITRKLNYPDKPEDNNEIC